MKQSMLTFLFLHIQPLFHSKYNKQAMYSISTYGCVDAECIINATSVWILIEFQFICFSVDHNDRVFLQ